MILIRQGDNVAAKLAQAGDGELVRFDGAAWDRTVTLDGRKHPNLTGTARYTGQGLALQIRNAQRVNIADLEITGGGIKLEKIGHVQVDGLTIDGTRGKDDWDASCISFDNLDGGTFRRLRLLNPTTTGGIANGVYGFHGRNLTWSDVYMDGCFEGMHLMHCSDAVYEDIEWINGGRFGLEFQDTAGKKLGIVRRCLFHKPRWDTQSSNPQRWSPMSFACPLATGLDLKDVSVICPGPAPTIKGRYLAGWLMEAFTPMTIARLHAAQVGDKGVAVCSGEVSIRDSRIYTNGQAISIEMYYHTKWGHPEPKLVEPLVNVITGTPKPEHFASIPNPIKGSESTPQPTRPVLTATVNGNSVLIEHDEAGAVTVTGRTTLVTERFDNVGPEGLTIANLVPGWHYWFKAPGYDEIEVAIPGTPPAGQPHTAFYAIVPDAEPLPEPEPIPQPDEHEPCRQVIEQLQTTVSQQASEIQQLRHTADQQAEKLTTCVQALGMIEALAREAKA